MEEKYILHYLRLNSGEPIARSGDAELVRYLDGHYELRGGTAEDQRALRDWISKFMHGISFTCRPAAAGQTKDSPHSQPDAS